MYNISSSLNLLSSPIQYKSKRNKGKVVIHHASYN